ncbi:MAG: BON domain-containing protein [Nitrospirae bacterium]|nr:MAG: BON domain-containing protein [Nitrospirota bacterium]
MPDKAQVITAVRAAFERERRINLHRFPVHMDFQDGVLTLEGEVGTIAGKKLAMELAIAVPGVTGIVDRLHVVPATPMGDGAILDAVRNALLQESVLQNCTIRVKRKGKTETVREALADPHGVIEVSVTEGVVLLDDHVTSLAQKRLAGVLAWWVPGSRDVINGMEVAPLQADSDQDVTKTVRLVLEKNRLIKSDGIRVTTHNYVVTLEGSVPTEAQKEMAEFDAWYVFGVDNVLNHLDVR